MIHMAVSKGMHSLMMNAVDDVNEAQKHILPNKILDRFGWCMGAGLQAKDGRHSRSTGSGID
jgi:UDP-glucose 6-dehydrogenase